MVQKRLSQRRFNAWRQPSAGANHQIASYGNNHGIAPNDRFGIQCWRLAVPWDSIPSCRPKTQGGMQTIVTLAGGIRFVNRSAEVFGRALTLLQHKRGELVELSLARWCPPAWQIVGNEAMVCNRTRGTPAGESCGTPALVDNRPGPKVPGLKTELSLKHGRKTASRRMVVKTTLAGQRSGMGGFWLLKRLGIETRY